MTNDDSSAKSIRTLNQQNMPWLVGVLVANAVIFYLVVQTDSVSIKEFGTSFKDWQSVVQAGLGAVVVGILTAQFNEETRARLVFWRWHNPLPGYRVFTEYGPKDGRFRMDAVETVCGGVLPTDPQAQNAKWYQLYRGVADRLTVQDAHRNYLFYRNYAVISILLIIAFGVSGFWLVPCLTTAAVYFVALVLQYGLVCRAAQNNGIAFVTNVLAEVVSP
jgi:hypothetical protein